LGKGIEKQFKKMDKKHIVIIGLGGVGGYFGFKINQANKARKANHVTFVARGETFKTVAENGLTLISPEHWNGITRPDSVFEQNTEIKSPDLILVCVKEYDLENVCRQLTGVISEKTIILPMMNGVDIYERIREIIPRNIILPSCIYVASHIKEKGVVEHKGKPGKVIIGRDPEHLSSDVNWIIDLMEESGIDFDFKRNSSIDIWTKFIFIASFGLVTAKHNSSIGAVCSEGFQKKEATGIMEEIKLIAKMKGIYLDEDIISKTFEKASSFPPQTPTSLQLDINSGKDKSELELFAGAIIKYGNEVNINTTATKTIYKELVKDGLD